MEMVMTRTNDLVISARDAEALAVMLGAHRRANPFEADASDELAEMLLEARLIPAERLPAERVAMGSTVTYAEASSGTRRTVTLAYPGEADATKGRVSVLSPVGLALLGHRRGAEAVLVLPNNRWLSIRILDVASAGEPVREAA
jgi:regulator of nucleoside diphosphate kinase